MSMMAMGLNHDTMKDLKPTDGITLPVDMNAGNGAAVVIDYNDGVTDEAGQKVIDNFEDYNVVLETGEGLEKEQLRLEDVAQVVMSAESISYSDVQNYLKMIDEDAVADENGKIKVSGVAERLNNHVPLNSFTEGRSSVNVPETKQFFKKELKLNQDKIHGLYNDFFNTKADSFVQRATMLVKGLEATIEDQMAWAQACAGFQATALTSKNYLAYLVTKSGEQDTRPYIKKLYDIRHVPLDNYSFTQVVETGLGICPDLFTLVGSFFRSKAGQSLMSTVRRSGSYDLSSNSCYYRTFLEILQTGECEPAVSSTYAELVAFFASGELVARLTQMKVYLEQNIELFAALRQGIVDGQPFVYEGKNYTFLEASQLVTGLISALHEAAGFCVMAESAKQVCLPVFVAMNDVLTA